jgi:hypothetical protein
MRFILFILLCFSFSYCFHPVLTRKTLCGKKNIPDFAALVVLESQSCPFPFPMDRTDIEFYRKHSKYEKQICTSRYRVIQVLHTVSDTIKKEYFEVKDNPVYPHFRHRPILISGRYKNGIIKIELYKETRDFFLFSNLYFKYNSFSPYIYFHEAEIYAIHSIGTPYYDAKNFDSVDMKFYDEFLIPNLKFRLRNSGKDLNELWQRLNQNRIPIKATKIKNDFAALGTIKAIHPINDINQTKLYELNVEMKMVFKNDTKIDSNITILIDKERLPLNWSCLPLSFLYGINFYFFGDLKNGNLVIESLDSMQDTFVFGDTIYDVSMGLSFDELLSYFLPLKISLEEFKFGMSVEYDLDRLQEGVIPKSMVFVSECLIGDIKKMAIKLLNFTDEEHNEQLLKKAVYNIPHLWRWLFMNSPINDLDCWPFISAEGDRIWGKL